MKLLKDVMSMKKNSIKDEILLKLRVGATREELNEKYNKGTVTKAYNEYLSEVNNTVVKDETVEQLFKKIFKIVDKEGQYDITIKIERKVKNKLDNIELSKEESLLNPYGIYYNKGKEVLVQELKSKNLQYLIRVTKKYFSDNSAKIYKEKDKDKVIEYIIFSLERLLNIGQSFR